MCSKTGKRILQNTGVAGALLALMALLTLDACTNPSKARAQATDVADGQNRAGQQTGADREAQALGQAQALYEAGAMYEAGALYGAQEIYKTENAGEGAAPSLISVKPKDLAEVFKNAKGHQAVVNFWAPWCVPCVEEMPELAAFYRESRSAQIAFISIVVLSDLEDRVRPFLKDNPVPFDVYYLDAASPNDVMGVLPWETTWDGALPATFLLDAQGNLKQEWLGATNAQELAAAAGLSSEVRSTR